MLLCAWRERGWRAEEFTLCHAQTTTRCHFNTCYTSVGGCSFMGLTFGWGFSDCLKPESENTGSLVVLWNHQTKRSLVGRKMALKLRSGTAVLFSPQQLALGSHSFKPKFLWDRWKSCPRTGVCVCAGWSVLVPAGRCVLGTSWSAEPGAAFGLRLNCEKLAIQPFFWPIDGALQLIFFLELEFGNSFKQVLSYC